MASWITGGVSAATVLVALVTWLGQAPKHVHPEPRTEADLSYGVMPPSFFAGNSRVQDVYRMAQQISVVLDGLYCYCLCRETIGHRSLYQCFQSQHGAGCDACLAEAELAYRMNGGGRTLNDIRAAIDATYGP